jgi:phosphatidylinositol alpha 1,6-mannosyltransferase
MRVAIVSESFLPQVNGVTNTVRHVVDRLVDTGHQVLVVAPGPGLEGYRGVRVVRVRSIGLPGYRGFRLGLPDRMVHRALAEFAPDVVHLASPVLLGAYGLRAARMLGLPTVAIYQTDFAGFAEQYGVPAGSLLDFWVGGLHRRADRTLVPSSASHAQLEGLGVHDLHVWRRGVSLELFDARRSSTALRARWMAHSGTSAVVGYVGRLAQEKQVRRLVEVAEIPGTHLVVIGDGPERAWLERRIPHATFTGMLSGRELAQAFASLDVFVHTGVTETFCQTVQEAQASGVAVVAPAAGGPLDLVEHGVTGLLYDPADPLALRRAVGAAAGCPDLRRRMADAGRAAVQHRSWSSVVDELINEHYPSAAGPVASAHGTRAA